MGSVNLIVNTCFMHLHFEYILLTINSFDFVYMDYGCMPIFGRRTTVGTQSLRLALCTGIKILKLMLFGRAILIWGHVMFKHTWAKQS